MRAKHLIISILLLILISQQSFAMNQEAYEYYQKSTMFYKMNEFEQAISYLKKAIQISPDDALLHTKSRNESRHFRWRSIG
jgi:tetratricopeptide (TPR) repeat protein